MSRSSRMSSKSHPCFVSPSDECCCRFVPRPPRNVTVSHDFVPHNRINLTSNYPMKSSAPVWTERRQEYEDALQIRDRRGDQSANSAVPESTPLPPDVNLLQIKSFREQHSIECMSTINRHLYNRRQATTLSSTTGHKCRHRFRLNDRNCLEPVLVDNHGLSACEECGKTTDPAINHSIRDLSADNYGPTPIIILIEAEVPPKEVPKSKHPTGEPKKGRQIPIRRRPKCNEIAFSSALKNQQLE